MRWATGAVLLRLPGVGHPRLPDQPALLAQVLLEIAEDPKAHDRDRIAAAREILDRGWGKAVGFTDIEGADPLAQDEVMAEIRSIAEALSQERPQP